MIPACFQRSRSLLVSVIGIVSPRSEKYLPHDVTGDGVPETFCNLFAHDVAESMGVVLPLMLANEQLVWLSGGAAAEAGWSHCTAIEAAVSAELGELAIAGVMNPEGHGHIAVVVPSTGGAIYVAQAGARCFTSEPIANGFGHHTPSFWRHP